MPDSRPETVFERRRSGSEVLKDRPDLRDLPYTPTLNPLRSVLMPPLPLVRGTMRIRSQSDAKTNESNPDCTAQALAGLWDVLKGGDPVSAGMLFLRGHDVEHAEFGRPSNQSPQIDQGLQSLRSIIKGLYHNGACSHDVFTRPLEAGAMDAEARRLVDIARDARSRPLGSYYRLKPVLNDYHAALNEVGAIYVAAEIHEGWDTRALKTNGGVIDIPGPDGFAGGYNHAFVIVGYNERGFLVLNSWGKDWGGYKLTESDQAALADQYRPKRSFLDRLPGVALWTYRDWAERIIDGWVLRFGVSAPDAFEYSYGEHGIGAFTSGRIAARTIPRHKVMGHYVHLDDGDFVRGGALPSSRDDIAATVARVNSRFGKTDDTADKAPYRDVLLWIAGGSESTKELVRDIAGTREFWKNEGIYPLTVMWCSDFIEKATSLLAGTFEESFERVDKTGDELDARIETECRGPGRAFWRDVKSSACRAAARDTANDAARDRPAGGLWAAYKELKSLDQAIRIHVVAEGAGAIALGELFNTFPDHADSDDFSRIASITLLAPACTRAHFDKTILRWRRGGRSGRALMPGTQPIRILTPDDDAERRLRVGYYGGSILKLVQMAFEEVVPERDPDGAGALKEIDYDRAGSNIIGLAGAARQLASDKPDDVELTELAHPGDGPIEALRMVTFAGPVLTRIRTLVQAHGEESQSAAAQ